MATIITDKDIININETYKRLGTYAATARETGFTTYMVKKYVISDYVPIAEQKEKNIFKFEDIPDFSPEPFLWIENFGEICVLSEEEEKEIKKLWEEVLY